MLERASRSTERREHPSPRAVGPPATAMASLPYAIIVDGTGKVSERKLGNHDGGSALASTVTVVSSTLVNGRRRVVLQRAATVTAAGHNSKKRSGLCIRTGVSNIYRKLIYRSGSCRPPF